MAGGAGRGADVPGVVARAAGTGLELLPLPTERPRHATELVAARLGDALDLVAVAGGDGTVGEVAEALLGTDVPIAILPTGTANVVAREYGIGRTVEGGERTLTSPARQAHHGVARRGPDEPHRRGRGVRRARHEERRPQAQARLRTNRLQLDRDPGVVEVRVPAHRGDRCGRGGGALSVEATFVLAANTRRYGGDAILSPFADPTNDLLDLVLFASRSRLTLMRWYGRLFPRKGRALFARGLLAPRRAKLFRALPRGLRAGRAGRRRRRHDDAVRDGSGRRGRVPHRRTGVSAAKIPEKEDS